MPIRPVRRLSPRPLPRFTLATLLLTAAGALAACGGGAPVAEVSAGPSELTLPYPAFRPLVVEVTPSAAVPDLADAQAAAPPYLFVHLVSADGDVLRTFDQPLAQPWRLGETQRQRIRLHQSALAPPLPPGSYRLTIGLYRPDGDRWPLEGGREVGDREYEVATVEVPEELDGGPRFDFSQAWLPVEAGTDRQILARRWLASQGTVRLFDAAGPGTLWMVLQLPPADTPGLRLVLDEGAIEPAVTVTSDCNGSEAVLSGAGRHDLELPIAPAADAEGESGDEGGDEGGCLLTVSPNYYLINQDSFERRAVALEVLSWRGE